jgi:hypothetical protein
VLGCHCPYKDCRDIDDDDGVGDFCFIRQFSGVEGVVRGLEGTHLADRCIPTKLV